MAGSIEQQGVVAPDEAGFTFRSLERSDLPMMFNWLNNPAVSEWWDDPPTTVDEMEGKYVPRLDGSEQVFAYIALYAGAPVGYLQWYRLSTEPNHPAVGLVPENAAAIDVFIGAGEYLHRGYGPLMIRAFLRTIVFAESDVSSCAIDPVPANHAAISAYRQAGFRDVGVAYYAAEQEDVLIMLINRAELISDGVAKAAAEAADADQHQE